MSTSTLGFMWVSESNIDVKSKQKITHCRNFTCVTVIMMMTWLHNVYLHKVYYTLWFRLIRKTPTIRTPHSSGYNNNKKAVLSQRWPRDACYISRSSAVAEIWPFEIIQSNRKYAIRDPPSPKTPPYNQTWSGSDDRLRRYDHLKFFQGGGGHHLGFVRSGNSAIRSAVPENPTLEQNMKWIGRPVAEISPLEIFPTWRWPPSWICSNRK